MLNVRDFGARGDGVTDDYRALQTAAAASCAITDATLLFPPGQYRVNRYRIIGGAARNSVRDIQFRNCHGTRITGYNAQIKIQGSFYRAADQVAGDLALSYSENVIPFAMINSAGFTIAGFEIDGGVADTTRDSRVTESTTAGIYTTNCHDYTLKDLDIHHFATDGITLGGGSTIADRNAILVNVSSHNNGRQGLSAIQLLGGRFIQSRFYETGRTGAYGAHLPAAGVDVEPVRSTPQEDVTTGNLVFDHCQFTHNLGAQLISAFPSRVQSITVRSSYVEATDTDSDAIAYLNAAAIAITEDSDFVFSGRHGLPFTPDRQGEQSRLSLVIYRNNRIRMDHPDSLHSPSRPLPVVFNGNHVDYDEHERFPVHLKNFKEVSANEFTVHTAHRELTPVIIAPSGLNVNNAVTVITKNPLP